MEGISHKTIEVNGISMHVAEKGPAAGPAILFIHGFPELWYSWRHQILSLSERGFRCIAPDMRGYGDTSAPSSISSYTIFHLVGDLIALLDNLSLPQVFVVGHDWGAMVAWQLCMFRPDRVKALVNLSVAFMPRNPAVKTVDQFRSFYGDDYYMCRFQEYGVVDKELASMDSRLFFKTILTMSGAEGSMSLSKASLESYKVPDVLPSWLSEEEIEYFASKFQKSGFTGGINYYRCLDLNWELTAPWTNTKVEVPTKYIVGDRDITYHYPGIQDFIHKGGLKGYVPLLKETVVVPGAGHFIQQERAQEISDHIYDFIKMF
ncbi:bifunctional epoxide hydrolase 2-like protein [Carex littledalei]|uniref:soluble epoxide hydrolase n=1 Tax=Carex littledalei TaxID=544730 RepID=A0A833RNN1_9POAL|nr:bifunctional epoxide hydrolase 2-like protein [Carex littledalei]